MTITTTTLHLFNGLFSKTTWVSPYQKGKTSLELNEARDDGVLRWQWHQLDHMQTICTSLQTDNHTNTSSLNFYRPDAFPGDQPTVSKHCLTIKPIKIQLYSILRCTHWMLLDSEYHFRQQKFCCHRTAPVEQFASNYATENQL